MNIENILNNYVFLIQLWIKLFRITNKLQEIYKKFCSLEDKNKDLLSLLKGFQRN